MNKKRVSPIIKVAGIAGLFGARIACAATDWSAQDYNLYAGDFNGDGKTDILYIAKDPSKVSGIALSDGSGPNVPWQSWQSNYLGIPWYGNNYNVIVADFNGDGKADIFLQRTAPGDSYLLLTNSSGKVTAISQTVSNGAMGLTWSADQHRIIAGDFNGDGKTDLFLQSTSASGLNAVVLADANGQFTSSAPAQSWNNTYLGFKWSTQNSIVYAGDFNGDRRADLLIQAKPTFVMINYDVPFPVPTYPPNQNGVVLAQSGSAIFTLAGVQAWSRNAFGVDWSTLAANVIVGNFNGAAACGVCSGVIVQAKVSGKPSYVLNGNSSGSAFSNGTPLASNVAWSADSYQLIAANFAGTGRNTGIYLQTPTPTGTNYYAADINGSSVSTTPHDPSSAMGAVPATAVGRTLGSFAVTSGGTASYTISVVVPPGVAGMEPALSLTYQSNRGNGPLGVGWALAGLSEIERCRKTLAQDGAVSSPAYAASDDYCLDGNKLRLTGGTYGGANSTYQTEIEQFSRITAVGNSGRGPDHFVIEGKNGLTYVYGNTSASRDDITAPSAWAVDKVTDRAGNYMTIQYAHDSPPNEHEILPSTISYTANDAVALVPAYQVQFIWETRPGNDVITRKIAGNYDAQRGTLRLKRIETYASDALVRSYRLNYNTSGASPRSRLNTVQECDGTSKCLPPTTISWQDGQVGLGADQTIGNLGSLAQYAIPVDINGDGRADVVYPSATTWAYMLANSSGAYDPPRGDDNTAQR